MKTLKQVSKYVLLFLISIIALLSVTSGLLKGTILENTNVVTFEDGTKDVVKKLVYCRDGCTREHKIYISIVSNEHFTSSECKSKHTNYYLFSNPELNKYSIINYESITKYLTNEEIVKASKDKLTKEDIANILNRIFTKEESKTK